jgi:glycosyltransferase involved in cell wall biosynthesis
MEKMPKVSVVIPTYNRASFLFESINSVLKQTLQDIEIIVVDDGSTDDTREMVMKYFPMVRYIYQENQGVSIAFNNGINLALGEYVAIFADDDIMLEDALEKSVTFFNQHPEVGFCHGQNYTIDENGQSLRLRTTRGPRVTFIRSGKEEIANLLFRDSIQASTVVIRRSCFQKVGLFDTNLRGGEDWDMWIRLSRYYPVGYLSEPLVKVRIHAQNLQSQGNIDSLKKNYIARLNSVFNDSELGKVYAHLRRKAYFGLYCNCSKIAAEKGKRIQGIRYMVKALSVCPELLFQRDGISLLLNTAKGFPPVWLKRKTMRVLIALHLW